ncbi:MAG TPA: helix-turn-helix domain-containing protein [Negativicutes bacterium]|nr:helix-turn-helix domain-containing protein [Negativicutes bacterium]
MADIKRLLEQASEITKKRIAVVTETGCRVYPEGTELPMDYKEAVREVGRNYKGWNIYSCCAPEENTIVCIEAEEYHESETTGLVILLVRSALAAEAGGESYLRKAVEGNYDAAELAVLEEKLLEYLPGYILLIDNFKDSREDVLEILVNSMNIKASASEEHRIVAVAEEENIEEACGGFVKNVLSELLVECKVAIGGRAKTASEIHLLYENCREAFCLKSIYGLTENVLDYEAMYGYRIAGSLDPKLKLMIQERVFTPEFIEAANGELGTTIEEFFRNNLNLTDTAAKLYVHRNTLLYRLDKIHKYTGFDLKRFEDSWLFKLAWMLHKENKK